MYNHEKNNLGSVLRKVGDLLGARTMYENAWRLSDQRLGETHAFTLIYKANLRRVNEAIVSHLIFSYAIQIIFVYFMPMRMLLCVCTHRMRKMNF